MILRFSNLYLGNHLDYFCIKLRSMDAQVLSRLFYAKIIQSTTATTSIVCWRLFCHYLSELQNLKIPLTCGCG